MSFQKAVKYMVKAPDKAAALFKKLLKEREFKEAWVNLGTCYKNMDNVAKAMECIEKAMSPNMPYENNTFSAEYPIGLNNYGLCLYQLERDEEARECYLRCLELDPTNYNCIWNLAELSLRMYSSRKGISLQTCWSLYDYRLKRVGGVVLKNKKKDLLNWDGISHVSSLVVLTEQGHGDMIMFGRYLSKLRDYADKIYVQCSPELEGLFSDYLVCRDPIETDATHGVAMCSLGGIFPQDIPAGDWLKNDRHPTNNRLRIGVAWSGNRGHSNDRNRSTSSGRFLPLSRWGDLYTLNPTEHHTKGFIPLESKSFAETLEHLKSLDLVITVDTALAHLCGAAGVECWVLMPLRTTDFRWGDTSMGEDNVWYSSVRVIRNPGSWEKTFEYVNEKLRLKCEV